MKKNNSYKKRWLLLAGMIASVLAASLGFTSFIYSVSSQSSLIVIVVASLLSLVACIILTVTTLKRVYEPTRPVQLNTSSKPEQLKYKILVSRPRSRTQLWLPNFLPILRASHQHWVNASASLEPGTPEDKLALSGQPRQEMARRRFVKVAGAAFLGGVAVSLGGCSQVISSNDAITPGSASPATATMPGMAGMTMPANTATSSTAAADPSATPTPNSGGFAGTLTIPPLLVPQMQNGTKVFNLTLQQGQSQFLAGTTTATLGINGNYLGPTLRAKQGDKVLINVTNHIKETTTLHWHGLHVPAAMDGGPHQVIDDNSTWSPQFTIQQPAATLWYHPHMMGQTQRQVTRGLVGMFILDDTNPVQNSLPHIYGVDDLPLIFQDETFGANGQLNINGGGGRGGGGQVTTLVNGTISPTITTSQSRLRLRLLNATSQRFYNFGFANNETFYQIASDGGLLPALVAMSRLQLAPAERAEIIIDLNASQPMLLQTFGGNGGGGRGGNNFQTNTLLTIKSTGVATRLEGLPTQLNSIERLQPGLATQTRDMVLGGNDRNPTINNQSMTSMADMMNMSNVIKVKLGTTEIWNLINRSGDTHAFHVHDIQFQVLDRNNTAPTANEAGLKDTVVVSPRETVRIIMRFTDFADPNTPYMFHCHILAHEDAGMMGQFVVVSD